MKKFTVILIAIVFSVIVAFSLTACGSDDLSAKIDEMQSTLDQLQEELGKSNSQVDGLQSALDNLQEEFEKSNANADELKEQVSQLQAQVQTLKEGKTIAEISYEKVKYIDENLSDRDCLSGENFEDTQNWIKDLALAAGYGESEVAFVDFDFTRRGTQYTSQNIVITKTGKSEKQIIVGAHYDGDGTGDNGSGIALALTTAEKLVNVETPYTIQFVFFSAEEYGCYGSTAYANAMTDEEVANTLYMINLDSLVCGDFCYIYGGVQDNENKVVTQTEAYDNAMNIAKSLGLDFHSNPWTWDNPEPTSKTGVPKYASPSTGDWSDHKGFKNKGIKYLYMEATNWEIPDYTGYGETVLVGMLMNTENDYLEYIEHYFPGRIQEHLFQFSTLLYGLLTQAEVNF